MFDRGYFEYHAPRYALVLRLLTECGLNDGSRILDIGPSRLTSLIRERFGIAVDTLGFGADQFETSGRHFQFNLNSTQNADQWRRDLPQYDFVVLAEVLEHLHTAPEITLAYVRSLMARGGTLILQTPNAASLPKRIKLLLGRNPYERIRLDISDPGHFREYTLSELRSIMTGAGFAVRKCATGFYFDARFAHHEPGRAHKQPIVGSLKNMLYPFLPSGLREGITIVGGLEDSCSEEAP
jgi:cyclopropane fatty-acyl-phospholipid synthase-like methyltransferase